MLILKMNQNDSPNKGGVGICAIWEYFSIPEWGF